MRSRHALTWLDFIVGMKCGPVSSQTASLHIAESYLTDLRKTQHAIASRTHIRLLVGESHSHTNAAAAKVLQIGGNVLPLDRALTFVSACNGWLVLYK